MDEKKHTTISGKRGQVQCDMPEKTDTPDSENLKKRGTCHAFFVFRKGIPCL
jgi:hypothetical protein